MSDQHLIGTEGNDFLEGADGNDWLEGLAGDDFLLGASGNDLLDGGGGSDELFGNQGDDVYVLQAGGADKVYEFLGDDEVRWQGVSPDQVERIRPAMWSGGNTNDLVLRIAGTTDTLTLSGYFYDPVNQVERVVFDDGTVWTAAELTDLRYLGTAGNDFLGGTEWSERLEGFGGSDELFGNQGDDVYVLQAGGADKVYEFLGDDEVRWQGVSPDQVERIRPAMWSGGNTNDLVLRIAGTTDTLTLSGYFYDPVNQVERVVFDDGTVWTAAELTDLRYLGTAGNDFLGGTEWSERLEGFGGSDELFGNQGDDVYVLQAGGADKVYEFLGDDEVRWQGVSPDQVERIRPAMWSGSNTNDLVLRIAGTTDTLTLSGYFYDPVNQVERVVFDDGTVWTAAELTDLRYLGTAGNDFLGGTEWSERLEGFAGSDNLYGAQGDDVFVLDAGGFDIVGDGGGNDEVRWRGVSADQVERIHEEGSFNLTLRIAGTTDTLVLNLWFWDANMQIERVVFDDGTVWGVDELWPTAGPEEITGTAGDDLLAGTPGIDYVMYGLAGNDTYIVDSEGDVAVELPDEGIDVVHSSVNFHVLAANIENVQLLGDAHGATGNELSNTLIGTDSFNLLDGGAGADLMIGGAGDDVYFVDNALDVVQEEAGGGVESVNSWVSYVLPDEVEMLFLLDGFFSTIDATGNSAANVLVGNSAANVLDGRAGADEMSGNGGDDTYIVDHVGDVVTEFSGSGFDSVETSLTYTLGANLERLVLTGTAAINGTGNALSNVITGNSAANTLDGGAGTDTLVGGAGDDIYVIDSSDHVSELSGGGIDTVRISSSYTLQANFENLTLVGTAAVNGTGNALANTITGNAAVNTLDGGAGADTLIGGAGEDIYIVDNVGDVIVETVLGFEYDTVRSSVSHTLSANVEMLYLTGTQAIDGHGNESGNFIYGNAAANVLTGGLGHDWLDGGLGADTLVGGTGDDTYFVDQAGDTVTENVAGGFDTVYSSLNHTLAAQVEDLILLGFGSGSGQSGIGNAQANRIIGNELNNVLEGRENSDRLYGHEGDDVLDGGEGLDELDGGAGNDTLRGGLHADTLTGGSGNDTYFVDNAGDIVRENAGEGIDTVVSAVNYQLGNNVENLQLEGSATSASGNSLANELRANLFLSSNLMGWEGADTLYGAAGHDVLDGGTGGDMMVGGAGGDTYRVDSTADVVVEEGVDSASDGVESSVSYALGANLETLLLTGEAAINGTGNALNNMITGNAAANIIDGGAGDDMLNGWRGSDQLRGGTGNDTYVFQAGNGTDFIEDTALPSEGNRVRFGAGIAVADLHLSEDANGVYLEIGSNGDALHFSHFSLDPAAMRSVETYEFANGSTLSHAALAAQLNVAPILANPLVDVAVLEDGAVDFQVPATAFADATAGDALTYSATRSDGSALPTWLTFDPATRGFSGVPANADVGSFLARVTATDRLGLSVSDTFAITVANVNDAPVLANALPDQGAQEDAGFSFTVPAGTFADIDAGDTLALSATLADGSALPSWLAFDAATRTFTGTPANGDVGTISLRVTATDNAGASASDIFDLAVANTNDAPTLADPIADQTAQDEVAFSFTVPANAFSDVDASDTLTYSAALADGAALPEWLSFNAATRTFEGTPPPAAAGTMTVRVTATDGDGLSASDDFDLSVLYDGIITGTDGADEISGTSGDDAIFGLAGDDNLSALEGDDVLDGGTGMDTMAGGAGNDLYRVDDSGDVVVELAGEGVDTIESSWLAYGLAQGVENLTLVGEAVSGQGNDLDNIITGNDLGNGIGGGAGDDVMIGGGGDDYLLDTVGNDRFIGGDGNDLMVGQDGNDIYEPGSGSNSVYDSGGDDELRMPIGVTPDQVSRIREGDHLILQVAGTTEQVLISQWFTEPERQIERIVFDGGTVWTPAEASALRRVGSAGNDVINGNEYDERIEGRDGDDVLSGGGGADVLVGGTGADTYVFDAWDGAGNTASIAAGDRVYLPGLSRSSVLMTRDESNLYITVNDTGASITLQSASGLPGEEGWRTTIEFGDGSVWSTENIVNTSPYIGTNGNDVLNGSEFGDQIFAVGGNDVVHGHDGNDVLYGGAGNDTLHGGAGDDYYVVVDAGDVLVEDAGQGTDQVESSVSFSLAANLENLFLTGTAASGGGNDLANVLVGNAAANILAGNGGNDILTGLGGDDVLDGGAGADAMHGGVGNDRYIVDDLQDQVFEDAGGGIDTVESSALTYNLGSTVENLTLTGAAVIGRGNESQNILVGNAGANTLYGLGGNDALSGMGGSDQLFAGAGNDELLGGDGSDDLWGDTGDDVLDGGAGNDAMQGNAGSDTYRFARGSGFDTVWEFLGTAADTDVVLLGADIAVADISVEYIPSTQEFFNDGGFLLRVNGTSDVLKLVWSPTTGADLEIEEVRFAGGTVWTESTLVAKAIENGEAPVLAAALADQAASEDSPFTYTLPADAFTDADIVIGDSLAYSAVLADGSALPTWLAFNAVARTFSGTPANGDVGSISVRVTATDESGRSASDVFDLAVANTNDAPTVAAPLADQAATEDSAFSFTLPAAAFADVDAGDTLSYDAAPANGQPMPSWLAFDAVTRTFSGTPLNGDVGTFSIRVTATDGAGAIASDVFDIVVANTNDAPTVVNAIADQSAQDTIAFSFTVPAGAFADIDPLDTLAYSAGPLPAWLSFNAATRTFIGTPGSANIGVTSVEVRATDGSGASVSDVFNITVGAAPDQIINGTSGNNTLTGGSGNDTINGLGGADSMSGGLGNDTYFVDNSGDQVNEAANAGIDMVNSSINYTLGLNVENLTLTGTANRTGTGNALDNIINGNSGSNTLSGGDGNDTLNGQGGGDSMSGGLGNDTYYVDNTGDTVNESASQGDDLVNSSISRTSTLWSNVEALVLTGTSNLTAVGNTGANLLRGNSGANSLAGTSTQMSGVDILEGGAGNDTLTDTSGNGLLNGGAGTDSLTGGSARELYIGGTGNDTISTGSGADIIAFNAGDGQDTVLSSAGTADNTLSLGGGIDYADLFFSRSGSDLVLAAGGLDQVTLRNWYAGTPVRNVASLQVIAEAMEAFDAGSSDPLLNQKVQRFNFLGLVGEFEASGLTSWALSNALADFRTAGSDSEALGGDLAYRYGLDGSLAGIGFTPAQQVLGASQFGIAAQTLRDDATVQQGAIRLG